MPDFGRYPHDDGANERPARGAAVPLGEALGALPSDAPPRDAWPALAARLGVAGSDHASIPSGMRTSRASPQGRWAYALATAAALALALLLPVPRDAGVDPVQGASDAGVVADGGDLPTLMRESARLERLIAAVDTDPLQPADALVLGLAFEDELAAIDAALSVAAPGSRDAEALWRQRVDVLSGYAELQSSRRVLAAEGRSFQTTLVALH